MTQFTSTFATNAPVDRHIVHCLRCQKPYDSVTAQWCNCLSKDRTLQCPNCGGCFCFANHSFKQTFWVGAPAVIWQRKMHEPAAARRVETDPALKRPLVLIVDDEPEIRAMAVEVVASLGYGYVVASNGEEGLALAREHRPEVVVTDAFMPKLDGREMCRRIKSEAGCGNPFVVIMTSLYKAVSKPFDAAKLRQTLRRLIGSTV